MNLFIHLPQYCIPSSLSDHEHVCWCFCSGVFQGKVRNSLNQKITASIAQSRLESSCLAHVPSTSSSPVVWSESPLITLLDTIVNDKVGPAGINTILDCITDGTGTLSLAIKSWNLDIAGLNSFYNLSVLAPYTPGAASYEPYNLQNTIGLGGCPTNTDSESSVCSSPTPLQIVLTSNSSTPIPVTAAEASFFLSILPEWPLGAEDPLTSLSVRDILVLDDPLAFLAGGGAYGSESNKIVGGILPGGTEIVVSLENLFLYLDLMLELNKAALGSLTVSQVG